MYLLYHAYMYLEFLILACTIYILAPPLVGVWIEILFVYRGMSWIWVTPLVGVWIEIAYVAPY